MKIVTKTFLIKDLIQNLRISDIIRKIIFHIIGLTLSPSNERGHKTQQGWAKVINSTKME